jgi:hypothetical protein
MHTIAPSPLPPKQELSRQARSVTYHGLSGGALTALAYMGAANGRDMTSDGALARLNKAVITWV